MASGVMALRISTTPAATSGSIGVNSIEFWRVDDGGASPVEQSGHGSTSESAAYDQTPPRARWR